MSVENENYDDDDIVVRSTYRSDYLVFIFAKIFADVQEA